MTGSPVSMTPLAVSWDEIHHHARTLAIALREAGSFKGIVAISRGGLVPAAILACELGIRLVETICVASYDGTSQGSLSLLNTLDIGGEGAGWLVVDDLADSGLTLQAVRKLLPLATFATIFVKPAGKPYTDHYVAEVPQDLWICFPWDPKPEIL